MSNSMDFNMLSSDNLLMNDVYASREFKLTRTKNKKLALRGMTAPSIMHAGIQTSRCLKKNHLAPMEKCTCGFYSFDSQRWYLSYTKLLPPSPGTVKAIVRLSGKIITHEEGLRAEKMEVVALCVNKWDVARLDSEYDDIPIYSSIQEMFNDFPISPLPREKRSLILDVKSIWRESREKFSFEWPYHIEILHEWAMLLGATLITLSFWFMFQNELMNMAWILALFGGMLSRLYSKISLPNTSSILYLFFALVYCVILPLAGLIILGFSATMNGDPDNNDLNARYAILNSIYAMGTLILMNNYVFRNLSKFFVQWIKNLRN